MLGLIRPRASLGSRADTLRFRLGTCAPNLLVAPCGTEFEIGTRSSMARVPTIVGAYVPPPWRAASRNPRPYFVACLAFVTEADRSMIAHRPDPTNSHSHPRRRPFRLAGHRAGRVDGATNP